MKFSYALVKRILPRVPAKAKLAEGITMHAFEVEEVRGDTLDIKLYANRYSDAASHLGIAREAAAIFRLPFKNPVKRIVNAPAGRGFLKVKVEDRRLCPRYAARYFEIEKISSSPAWIQNVLRTCGLKPINGVVDIMNYVMLETGQPLHAFDFNKLYGRNPRRREIFVRRAKRGEKIETLDGQKFALDPGALVIADGKRPLAIAGIKGGVTSRVDGDGVEKGTTRIVVEAANFDPVSIYRTSRKLGLMTDASVRFSHYMSPALVDWGLDRATEFLADAGAKLVDSVDVYPRPVGDEMILFDCAAYLSLMGAPVSPAEARRRFVALGFEVRPRKKGTFLVRVPAWRTDIESSEDLVEEVARLGGYDPLPPRAPLVALTPPHEEEPVRFKEKAREILTDFELDEVYHPTFVGSEDIAEGARGFSLVKAETSPVEVMNPIVEDKKYLRPNLAALLLRGVRENGRFSDTVKMFELGKVFGSVPGGGVREKLSAGIALGEKRNPKLILELKGIVGEFLAEMGLEEFDFEDEGKCLRIESDHHVIGRLQAFALPKQWWAAVAEVDAERLLALIEEEREFKPLPRFPGAMRDLSVVVGRDARIGEMMEVVQSANPKLIEDVDLVDEWTDERLGGKQSVTFRIVFQAEDRTLTDEEVNREMEKIAAALKRNFGAEIR